jgi:hypothetical protein
MGAGGAMLLGLARLTAVADGIDPRLAKVMSGIIGVDMHNHVYPAGTEPHPQAWSAEGTVAGWSAPGGSAVATGGTTAGA